MASRQPIRTCVGCRAKRAQLELIRLHLDGDGRLAVDRRGSGRGAWLCNDRTKACFEAARQQSSFNRALRASPDPASLQALADEFGLSS